MSRKKQIESLDASQLAELALHSTTWSARTRDSSSLDSRTRRAIEAALALWYQACGLRWHGVVVYVDSPPEGRLAAVGCADKLWRLRRAGQLRQSRLHASWLQCLHWRNRLWVRISALARAIVAGARRIPQLALGGACGGIVLGCIWGMFMSDYCMRMWCLLSKSPMGATLSIITGFILSVPTLVLCAAGETGAIMLGCATTVAVGGKLSLMIAAWAVGVDDPGPNPNHLRGWLQTMGISGLVVGVATVIVGAVIVAWNEYKSRVNDARIVDVTSAKLSACFQRVSAGVAAHVSSQVIAQVRAQLRPRIADVREPLRVAMQAASGTLESPLSVVARGGAESAVRSVLTRYLVGPIPLSIGTLEQGMLARHEVPCIDGQLKGIELAELAFYRKLSGRDAPSQEALLNAFETANSAGPIFAHSDFLIVCARPEALHAQGTALHRAEGPALQWPGFRLYFSHGRRIEQSLLERTWTAREIAALQDDTQRRAVIEYLGWPRYLELAGVPPLATADDPGNPGQKLALYDPPPPYTDAFRVLTMTNGSREPNGQLRVFGEPVPEFIRDPIEGAAWAYDCPADVYRQLRRRT